MGYYQVLKQILLNYGIPSSIKTDNRMVFSNNQITKNPSLKTREKDSYTQFGFACKQLGISLITTSNPQNKGRVERCFGTLQSRLITEMKINNVKTLEAANCFLEEFVIAHNKKFALQHNVSTSVFSEQMKREFVNQILAVYSYRKTDSGCSIKFENKYYQIFKNNELVNFRKKTECLVIKNLEQQLFVSVENQIYQLKELKIHKDYSYNFDLQTKPELKEKNHYIPPQSHP